MKEIDFLPQWYKTNKRRQSGYRTQYVALAGLLAIMTAYNLTASHSISKAKAQLGKIAAKQKKAQTTSARVNQIKTQLETLQKKLKSIEEIDSRINVAAALAELSFLIDENIVLGQVQLIAEKFKPQPQKNVNASTVRVAPPAGANKENLPLGPVRFRIIINGLAADASDVATLVCRLEKSPYFCQVIPSFARNKQIKLQTYRPQANPHTKKDTSELPENLQVSEFEINCYLANYRQL